MRGRRRQRGLRRVATRAGIGLLAWAALALAPRSAAPQPGSCILRAELDGVVNPGSADYLSDAVAEAERRRCAALYVRIDTPGGMLDSTRVIVRAFLGARVPIVAHVAPAGARAGSAGAFITMAAHVAAMAPGTAIGASHPVTGTGQDPEQAGGEHMGAKVENDTAAFARSIAEQRGRNIAWAEKAVRESASVTALEAESLDVIDRVERSDRALLDGIDGMVVELEDGEHTLATKGVPIVDFAPTIQQRVLRALGHPNLAYALLMLGLLGIVVEVQNPGMFVPGGAGVLCILLALIGLDALPVSAGGVALLAIAALLLVAEVYVTSYGLLTAAATACLLLGSALLIDTDNPEFFADPSVKVSWGAVVPLAVVLAGATLLLGWTAAKLRGRRSPAGQEGMVGERGRALSAIGPDGGAVAVHGERWNARAEQPIAEGRPVEVVSVSGLELTVAESTGGSPGES